MRYVSTRGEAAGHTLSDVLLAGLAPDGGLYLPEGWPQLDPEEWTALRPLEYPALAAALMRRFAEGDPAASAFERLCAETYAPHVFRHAAVAPLVQMERDDWMMELFWGPTLAFKDFALQLVGRLFDAALTARDARLTVVGATSGDTGSAAIEACRGLDRVDVFILHPAGRVSDVQRRQMTTVDDPNVHVIAVEGTFDDCQDLVKALFADARFREEVSLGAVNSINWARVLAQVVYYAWAALRLGAPERPVSFCVPTGNFGNVFAGWVARTMGLPIGRLYVGSNRNDILPRFFSDNDMRTEGVTPSLSPSMDIQISSNFERLLFELAGRDGDWVAQAMRAFRTTGRLQVPSDLWGAAREVFAATAVSDAQTLEVIRRVHADTHHIVDPHTAVGLEAARRLRRPEDGPIVTLSTAHPAKFPDAVERAIGVRPALPPHLADLMERPERFDALPHSVDALKRLVSSRIRR